MKDVSVYGIGVELEYPPRKRILKKTKGGWYQHYWVGSKKPRMDRVEYTEWVTRRDGFRQRYHKVRYVPRVKKRPLKGRFEFHGSGNDLYRAVQKTIGEDWIPRGYQRCGARAFLKNPSRYARRGRWVKYDVES